MRDDITVVVPVYNGALHLAETISSVLAQTLRPASIVVVDDGSHDGTAQVARQFAQDIRYVKQDHAGAAKARNTGMEHVKTDYVAFLDSDDLWAPFKLEL